MSKKLLIAVLTLGLLFAYCGAVLGSDANPTSKDRISFSSRVPLHQTATPTPIHQPSLARSPQGTALASTGTLFPPPYYCDFIDYSGGSYSYGWSLPTSDDLDYYNMRFTAASGYSCTVSTAYVGLYPAWFYGTPDLIVKVWDDDGFGLPGTELASVTVPNGDLPTSAGYASADLSSFDLVFEDGTNFYVGISTTDQSGADTLVLLSDDGSNGFGRSGAYDNIGGAFFNLSEEGIPDYNWLIGIDECCADLPYSHCAREELNCGATYYYQSPHPTDGPVTDFNTHYMTGGTDTLTAIGIATYAGGTAGYPDLGVYVWGSSGGFPDLSNVIFNTTIANADITWFPATNHIDMPGGGIVMPAGSGFHVGWETIQNDPSDILAGLMDDGSCGEGASSLFLTGDTWYMNVDWFGDDLNWIMYADICADEFSECSRIINYCSPYYIYSMPNGGGSGRIGGYEKLEPVGLGCRLQDVRIAIDNPVYYGYDPGFNYSADIIIREDDGGAPGAIILDTTWQPADFVEYPDFLTWNILDHNLLFDAPVWVGIVTNAPDPYVVGTPDFFLVGDDDGCGGNNAYAYYGDDTWADYSGSNFLIDGFACCIPPPERDCELGQPDPNWPTSGHDFRRSSASYNSVGDARCNQAVAWAYNDPTGCGYDRPVIYDSIVLLGFNGTSSGVLRAFDIADGSILWSKSGLGDGIGSNFRNSLTVKDGYVYYGGGSARSMTKADVYTGAVVWQRGPVTGNAFPTGANTIYTTTVILDCDGTEVLIVPCANGSVFALDAATGDNYAGWAVNPIVLDGNPSHTLSSNGVDVIYIATDGINTTGDGTVYAIDVCTGETIWTIGPDALAGGTITGSADLEPPASPQEEFYGPLAVDEDGSIYAQTGCWWGGDPTTPTGVNYRFSSTGNVTWAKASHLAYFDGVVIDANSVYFTNLNYWTSEVAQTTARSKNSGARLWQADPFFESTNYIEGALSCETFAPDYLFVGNTNSQFLVLNADDGTVDFEYNYAPGASTNGCGVAIDPGHVVMNNASGDLFCLTNQVDRPRLRLLKFDELQPVPFFSPNPYIVTFDDVFMNNGCANLTGDLTADENAPAAYAWSVDPDRIVRLSTVANSMVDNTYESVAKHFVKPQKVNISDQISEFENSAYSKDSYSKAAAYGPPAWLNSITVPNFDLAPGETFSVVYDVNGPLVTRGPHRAYVTINSNHQYYLNTTDAPVVQLGVLGGCLQIDDFIAFGVGEANLAPVFNTGEIGNRDGSTLWTFDDNETCYWQGGLFFAAEGEDGHRLAWTTDSWHAADPPDFWNSLLPDPNCFNNCEPYVTPSPIVLGSISHDGGLTYDDVEGYATAVAYIDSVINFDCYGDGWNWANVDCPYDNALTLGLRVQEFMYAAIDEPALANVVIFKYDVTNRNASPIVNVGIGAFNDYDMSQTDNGTDVFLFDENYSIARGASSANATLFDPGPVWGNGKIPMDADPMLNSATLDADQAMWEDNYVFLDSVYYYLANVRGQTAQAGIDMTFPSTTVSSDRDQWAGYIFRDFAASETYTFGTYMFGFEDAYVTDDAFWQNLAKTVNQFAGFNRGDINNDGVVNLADVVALWNMQKAGGPGPLFQHLADVNADGSVTDADITYLANYYFCSGPAPVGEWTLPDICPAK